MMSEKEIRDTGATKLIVKRYSIELDDDNNPIGIITDMPTPQGKKHVRWIPKGVKLRMYNDDSLESINVKLNNKIDPDFEIDKGSILRGNSHVESI